MFSALFDHVAKFTQLDEVEKGLLSQFLEHRSLKKREHLFKIGETCASLSFVLSGCMRMYMINEFANERTLSFGLEQWWICDWESYERGNPSLFAIQAVEDTRLATISIENYEAMLKKIPAMERYFRRIYQRTSAAAQRRLYMKETESAEERYWNFQRHYPDFVQRVPQYMLASFLGFSPEFLSKIRAKGERS